MHDPDDRTDALDRLLDESAPRIVEPAPAVTEELARMSVAARMDRRPTRTGRSQLGPVGVASVLAAVLLAGGATAAAATTWNDWSPWAHDPDGVLAYTLPSGAECESRIGGFIGLGQQGEMAAVAVRDLFSSGWRPAERDIADRIAERRLDRDIWFIDDRGARVPGWYGTEHYPSIDLEYHDAVQAVVRDAVSARLDEHGIDLEGGSWNGETSCPGADW